MTKQEYMEKLAAALEERVPEMKDEVLEDYEAHFNMAMAEGKSEEQICEDLGDIDDFVSEFASMEGNKANTGKTFNFNYSFEGKTFEDIVGDFSKGLKEAGDAISKGMTEVVESLKTAYKSDEVQNAIKNGKTFVNQEMNMFKDKFEVDPVSEEDIDPEDVSSTSVNTSSIKKIIVDAVIADVTVEKSEDDKVHIEYENNGSLDQQLKYRYYFKEENDTIYTGVKKTLTKAGLFSNAFNPNITLRISIPVEMDSVTVISASGELEVSGVKVKNMKLQAASGDMNLEDVECESLMTSTVSGDIKLDNVVAENLAVSTTSGDVVFDGKSKKTAIKTVSGDIDIETDETFEGSIGTVNGDIDIDADCNFESSISTTNGDVNIKLNNNNDGYSLSFQTVNGDVSVDYDGESHTFSKNGKYDYGEKGTVIYAKTVSGDIELCD